MSKPHSETNVRLYMLLPILNEWFANKPLVCRNRDVCALYIIIIIIVVIVIFIIVVINISTWLRCFLQHEKLVVARFFGEVHCDVCCLCSFLYCTEQPKSLVVKNTQKVTKNVFLIGQNKTKCAKFRGNSPFQSCVQHKNKQFTYLLPVG